MKFNDSTVRQKVRKFIINMLTFIRNQNFEQDAVYNIEACSYATKRNYCLRRRNFTFVGKKIEI